MEKSNIEKRIKILEKEREKYRFIVEKLDTVYLSDSERINFVNENKTKIEELNKINKEISNLEWSLLTPAQQKDYLDKYSDD